MPLKPACLGDSQSVAAAVSGNQQGEGRPKRTPLASADADQLERQRKDATPAGTPSVSTQSSAGPGQRKSSMKALPHVQPQPSTALRSAQPPLNGAPVSRPAAFPPPNRQGPGVVNPAGPMGDRGGNPTTRLRTAQRVLMPQLQSPPSPPTATAPPVPDFSEIDWDAMDDLADATLREERRKDARALELSGKVKVRAVLSQVGVDGGVERLVMCRCTPYTRLSL